MNRFFLRLSDLLDLSLLLSDLLDLPLLLLLLDFLDDSVSFHLNSMHTKSSKSACENTVNDVIPGDVNPGPLPYPGCGLVTTPPCA
jgi:hypothetical protein